MGSVKAKALMTPGSGNRGMLCGAARYLNYFLPVRVPHNVWLKAAQLSDMAFLPVWPVDSRLLYGPVRARRYDGPHSAFKINVQALCGFPYGFLSGLQNPYGSSMGSFDVLAYRCSKIRMASAQANNLHVRAPYGSIGATQVLLRSDALSTQRIRRKKPYACDRWTISHGIPNGGFPSPRDHT